MVILWALVVAAALGEEAVPECAVDPWVRPARPGAPAAPARDFAPFRAPLRRGAAPVFARGRTTIVFVHVSKCAGSTMKRALADAARVLAWLDGRGDAPLDGVDHVGGGR